MIFKFVTCFFGEGLPLGFCVTKRFSVKFNKYNELFIFIGRNFAISNLCRLTTNLITRLITRSFAAACLGQISRNVRRIDFAMDSSHAYRIRVVLLEESLEDRKAIEEILEDFEATREPSYEIPVQLQVEVLIEAGKISRPPADAGYLGLYCEKSTSG